MSIGNYGLSPDPSSFCHYPSRSSLFYQNLIDRRFQADVHARSQQSRPQEAKKKIGTAAENEHPLSDEVAKDHSKCDGRVIPARTIGITNWLEQKSVNLELLGEKVLQKLSHSLIRMIEKIPAEHTVKEVPYSPRRDPELLDQNPAHILVIKRRSNRKLRVIKADLGKTNDVLCDFLAEVTPAAFDHGSGEAMEGDIEDNTSRATEVRGQSADLSMLLQQKNRKSAFGQTIGRSQAC
jgi:hypothetical protein